MKLLSAICSKESTMTKFAFFEGEIRSIHDAKSV